MATDDDDDDNDDDGDDDLMDGWMETDTIYNILYMGD